MDDLCDKCFLNKWYDENVHKVSCGSRAAVCCNMCVLQEQWKHEERQRDNKYRWKFTMTANKIKFNHRRTRSSFYVSNNWFGSLIIKVTKMLVKPFGFKIRLRGRTPIVKQKGMRYQDLPLKLAKYKAIYFDKPQTLFSYIVGKKTK
jgi:hypothetical protein